MLTQENNIREGEKTMEKKMWNVYLIHHSHTDIGYTERQEKIMRYHYDFIRQAIEILDDIHSGKNDWLRWLCMAV